MNLSEEEKAKAYQEQVARAEAMKNDPSLRPASKPLVDVPSLGSIFGNPFAKKDDEDGTSSVLSAFDQAKAGWQRQVEQQRAANGGLVDPGFTFVSDAEKPAPEEQPQASSDADTEEKIAALEAEVQALKIAQLEAEIEQLKRMSDASDEA
jgi:hypothetical protein